MSKKEQDLKKEFKNEIDEILFKDLHFDSQMKNNVRSQIRSEKHRSVRSWLSSQKHRWSYATVAATIVIFVIFSTSSLIEETKPPNESLLGDNETNVLVGPDDSTLNKTTQVQELQSFEEAKELYSKDLLIPNYVPEGFKLQSIKATGNPGESAVQIIYEYLGDESSFQIIQTKQGFLKGNDQGKSVDINGMEGWINIDKFKNENEESVTLIELMWKNNSTQVMINGLISNVEALKIARSLK